MNAYNLAARVAQAHNAGATDLLDPGSGGTVIVANKGLAVLKLISGTGARTLNSALQSDVGDEVLVVSSVASATVNSVTITDGGYLVFRVTLDASGVRQWTLVASNNTEAYLERAVLTAIPLETFRVHDNYTANLPSVAADDDDLELLSPTIGTTAPAITATVSNATVTKEAIVAAVVPTDYVAGTAISIVIPWLRTDAATTSATLDLTAFRAAAPTVDICATAAQDINAAASGTATFVLTPTDVVPGEQILLNLLVAVVDATTSLHVLSSVNWSYTPVVN